MKKIFTANHGLLLKLYIDARAGLDEEDIISRLTEVRTSVQLSRCVASLVAYENYLELVTLHVQVSDLKEKLTLLEREVFEQSLHNDPSQPFDLIGAGVARLKQGDALRGRQLLRRVANSRYPERRQAQLLLGNLDARDVPV